MTKNRDKKSSQETVNHMDNHIASSKINQERMIYPIIVYPFSHPKDPIHIKTLYEHLVKKLAENKVKYHYPITVFNHQTFHNNHNNKGFHQLLENTIKIYSEVTSTWSVDTCATWLAGLGFAYDKSNDCKRTSDVFWLIPGDFNYHSSAGREALSKIEEIPNKVYGGECELCLGEIEVPLNSSKQLIDTYGTYGLLYNWFPAQAQGIAERTSKPRTEFFAIGHNFC